MTSNDEADLPGLSVTINRLDSGDFKQSSCEEVEQLVLNDPENKSVKSTPSSSQMSKKSILKSESNSSLNVLVQKFDPNMFDKFEVRLV